MYSLPYFSPLDPQNLEEYYDIDIEFNEAMIQVDLNFENNFIDIQRLDIAKQMIENISALDKKNKKYLEQDYQDKDSETVRLYVEHHLEEIGQEELSAIINFDNTAVSPAIQLLNSLRLLRVGLYPERKDQFAVFDYSIGRDYTQYLVVINLDESGSLTYLAMES